MICGFFMVVVNGLILFLGVMIYGKLIDEFVICENCSCIFSESIMSVRLKDLVILEMIYFWLEGINVIEIKWFEVMVNKIGI